jgi:hypothetical protein
VQDRFHTREVGADQDGAERRHDEQRRRLQINLVPKQLIEGAGQLVVRAFELPAETFLQIGVGEPAGYSLLEGEHVGVPVTHGAGMADQIAEV